ncbi:MAG: hypothetical protein LBP76_03370 [Treponema sp.]|jgi:hypothetical protein|nr:hypothetical protein [Treponema sp.]
MSDWMPGRRADQIVMCRNWIDIMTPEVQTAWGIPAPEFTELGTLFGSAQGLLQKAQSSDRTPVITEQCKEAFEALDGKMRFFKGHYFLIPPLTNADIVNLGLTPRDTSRTPVPKPEAQVEADMTFPGIHLVELQNIRAVGTSGIPDLRSDYGVRIYYGLSGPPSDAFRFRLAEEPKSGKELPYSIFTRRKKERFDFDGESGSRVYFCLRYENAKGGKEGEGPFGPLLSAIIP